MSAPLNRRWDPETALVLWFAACVSIGSFLFYLRQGDLLLYGDAVAHINIARRVFDSRTPGLLQLGTVWLPLPHLLMIPFLLSDWAWQTGVGGSIPSLAAYVLGALGIFRLVRECSGLSFPARHGGANRSLDCDFDLRCKSKPDLYANNRHDRATLPGAIYLDGGVLQRIRAGVGAEERRSGEVWPVIVGEMRRCVWPGHV